MRTGKIEKGGRKVPSISTRYHDKMKDEVRKDSAAAQFDVLRMMLSLEVILGIRICIIDIKGDYIQGGANKRCIYVREPSKIPGTCGTQWLFSRLPYSKNSRRSAM